ncbi:tRNA-uridine aminocarboxypropyltransferase [Pseudomonas sp. N040]|uniref:tRNA-uridine aminocarboxypropyltransferase n=1 Tax=Pseudomonas sp. N040 TaxID=2785325 RepID=UPI0018A25DF6|nr:tRNA-uridine aminocarboxypropyltransferase [Pseudomonas sp. N040]MBF7729743.1 DTW domain-containing protein [Pseudomonas sp. N040]MBW7013385.1 DTW domain-containing protein [Pseudomonas sp. N040]
MSHAVARLRAERLARSVRPFNARGSRVPRCPHCRVAFSYCLCAWRPQVSSVAGVCLLMYDTEPLKPSNTGWLIADVVADTAAFGWSRTEPDPAIEALLNDPQWQPIIVFPGEYAEPERVVERVPLAPGQRPLFVLLDATWMEARKMFRKSPYLDRFPVLSLQPEQLSRYRLRRAQREEHLCTAEVAALCLELAGDQRAAQALDAYLDVFTEHYLAAKRNQPLDLGSPAHQALQAFLPG